MYILVVLVQLNVHMRRRFGIFLFMVVYKLMVKGVLQL